jgi:hypothetical protein
MPVEFQMLAEDSTAASEQSAAGHWYINGNVKAANRKHPMNTTSPQGVDGRIVVA